MNLVLSNKRRAHRVSPMSVLDYETFRDASRGSGEMEQLNLFEKFIAAGILTKEGYDTYLNPVLTADERTPAFEADVCGMRGDRLMIVLCSSGLLGEREWDVIRRVNRSKNAKALIISPHQIDKGILEREVPGALEGGRLRIETLGWFEDTLERTLQDTLYTIELLVNQTRMRMMAPLLHKSVLKKDLRAKINPKLVYHNLSALSDAGLVDEPIEGTYELSQLGQTVLAELIAFLERTRRTLDDHKNEEVKSIGRR